IGCFLVGAPQPAQRVPRCCFSCANKIQLDDALHVLIILFRQSQSHGSLIFTQVARDDKAAGVTASQPSLLVNQRLPKRLVSMTSTRGRPSSRTTGTKDTAEIFVPSFKPTSSNAPRFP